MPNILAVKRNYNNPCETSCPAKSITEKNDLKEVPCLQQGKVLVGETTELQIQVLLHIYKLKSI